MAKIEDVLAVGSTEMPDCLCGAEMTLVQSGPTDKSAGTQVRLYECPACKHQLNLMVWHEAPLDLAESSTMVG